MKYFKLKIFLIILLQAFIVQNIALALAGITPSASNAAEKTMLSPRIGIMVSELKDSFIPGNSDKISFPALSSFHTAANSEPKPSETLLSQLIDKIITEFEETANDYKYSYLPDIIPLMNQQQINRYLNVLGSQISTLMANSTTNMIKRTTNKLSDYPDIDNNGFDAKDYFADKLLTMMQHYFKNAEAKQETPSSYGLYPYFKAIGQLAGKNTYTKLKNMTSIGRGISSEHALVKTSQKAKNNTQILLNTMLVISLGELRNTPEDNVYDFLYACAKMPIGEKDKFTPELKGAANMALGKLASRFLINNTAKQNEHLNIYNFLHNELSSEVQYEHSRSLYPTVGAAYGLGALLTGRADDWNMFFYVGFDSLYYVMDHPFIKSLLLQEGNFWDNAIAKLNSLDKFDGEEKADIIRILLLHEKYLKQHGLVQDKDMGINLVKEFFKQGIYSPYAKNDMLRLLGTENFRSAKAYDILLEHLKDDFMGDSAKAAIEALNNYSNSSMIPYILKAYKYRTKDSTTKEGIKNGSLKF